MICEGEGNGTIVSVGTFPLLLNGHIYSKKAVAIGRTKVNFLFLWLNPFSFDIFLVRRAHFRALRLRVKAMLPACPPSSLKYDTIDPSTHLQNEPPH